MAKKKIEVSKSLNAMQYKAGVKYEVYFGASKVLTSKDEGRAKIVNKIKAGMIKLLDGTLRSISVTGDDGTAHYVNCYNLPPIKKAAAIVRI